MLGVFIYLVLALIGLGLFIWGIRYDYISYEDVFTPAGAFSREKIDWKRGVLKLFCPLAGGLAFVLFGLKFISLLPIWR